MTRHLRNWITLEILSALTNFYVAHLCLAQWQLFMATVFIFAGMVSMFLVWLDIKEIRETKHAVR